MVYRLPPEWYPQDAVLLIWPHAATDWRGELLAVEACYRAISREVLARQALVVVCHDGGTEQRVRGLLQDGAIDCANLHTVIVPSNDTWARDCGPLTVVGCAGAKLKALDFTFNGWGNKYDSALDNAITAKLCADTRVAADWRAIDLVLEGGAIEVDGDGHLLTTEQCLLNKNRNPHLPRAEIEARLHRAFGTDTVLWLKHGQLAGDDTDSHIDTLARLAPGQTIVYVRCDEKGDSHFGELAKMEAELQSLRSRSGEPFRLLPLPWPAPCYNTAGERLPATYANFLVINNAVLVPTYGHPQQDNQALAQMQQAFPDHQIVGINCLPLIEQFGSLHCITMQLPEGFLAKADPSEKNL